MAIVKDTKVKQVMPSPIEGIVVGYSVDANTGEVLNCVAYTDEQGNEHQSYFTDAQLTVE